ncbi:polysaccharide pyruvyl transferase family protein [Parahaliea mediterranea]|uniref:polysaccharide pyruvyl transferase family protein n=1 Tax=Parahaliea mediterranea TaxID=651086 RepID=UPI001300429B|nr:polysaccharide pyruvyl transferase family protein [Parahaliea mediterranea]
MKALRYIVDWYAKPTRGRGEVGKPTLVNFPITDNCNSRCLMCNVWQENVEGELNTNEIFSIFSADAFSEVAHIGVSGGEPTLRKDLVASVESLLEALPKLQSLSITSHGYHYRRWSRFIGPIKTACQRAGVELVLNLSVDGVGEQHNEVRGIESAFERVGKTLTIFKNEGVRVQLQCTVSRANVYGTGRVLAFARQEGVEVIFRCATFIERLANGNLVDGFSLNTAERSFLADLYRSPDLIAQTRSAGRRLYYKKMAVWLLEGGARPMPCYFQNEGILVTSLGEAYPCSVSDLRLGNLRNDSAYDVVSSEAAFTKRAQVKSRDCSSCIHDQSGAWHPWELIVDGADKAGLVAKLNQIGKAFKTLLFFIGTLALGALPTPRTKKGGDSALLIGAYGGEHVGDAAILAGVIARLESQHGVRKITVASFRPDRTRAWVEKLDLPVPVEVAPANHHAIRRLLNEHSHVVYAGGPLMELPAHLARHLFTFALAARGGVTRVIEGVGVGPLNTAFSKWCVSKLFALSDASTIRQERSAAAKLVTLPANVRIGRDPAFDYLESRSTAALADCPLAGDVAQLILGARHCIGINLRPLWVKYSTTGGEETARIEEQFIAELCSAMEEISRRNEGVRFIFFPMNPDQFGFSDFNPATAIERHLSRSGAEPVDYRVWSAEPDPDSILFLLSAMDAVIAMRFHACIFAMSLNKANLLGIDYQIGRKGKVSLLLESEGLPGQCFKVESVGAGELVDFISIALEVSSGCAVREALERKGGQTPKGPVNVIASV